MIDFPKPKGKEICRIKVYHSTQQAYYEKGLTQQFFVRRGNSTRTLSMEDSNKYIRDTWKLK